MLKRISLIMVVLLLMVMVVGCGGGGDEEIIVAPPLSGEGDEPDEDTVFAAISLGSQLGATAGDSGSFSVDGNAPGTMAQLINEKRCEAGLTPIVVNALLNQAAEANSQYAIENWQFSPVSGGTTIGNTGYQRGGYWYLLQCGGYDNDPQHYFDNWWNYGGQSTILADYQEIGVGLLTGESGFSAISLFMTTPAGGVALPSCSDLGF